MRSMFKLAALPLIALVTMSGCIVYVNEDDRDRDSDKDVGAETVEETMNLGDVPAPVRATLERESAGGTIHEIEKESENGRTQYSAQIVVNGVTWDVKVGADGTLLSKALESDDNDEHALAGDR